MPTPHHSPEILDVEAVLNAQVAPEFRAMNQSTHVPDLVRDTTDRGLPKRNVVMDRFDPKMVGVESPADPAPETVEVQTTPQPVADEKTVALGSLLQALPREQEPPQENTRATAEQLGSLLRALRPGYTSRPAKTRPTNVSRLIKPRRTTEPVQQVPAEQTAANPDIDKTVELNIAPSATYPATPRSETGPGTGRHRAEPKRTRPFSNLLRGLRR